MKTYWAPFLHFYQPPTQDYHILKEINDTCYEPIFNMLLENVDYKITFNVNSILLDLLMDHGLEHTISLLKELVQKNQVELVGTGKFHPILPLIPKKEIAHQIALQEKDLQKYCNYNTIRGFFPPEMAISQSIVSLLSRRDYTWVICSGIACSGEWAYDSIYQSPEGFYLFFRDDVISNEISFKKISVDFFLEKIKVLYDSSHYIITAQDGETFGHHIQNYERSFLQKVLEGAIEDQEIGLCHISDLINIFPVKQKIKIIPSSWSTDQRDLDYNVPFPLWNHPDNDVHRIQFKFLKVVVELINLLENGNVELEVQEARTARYFLDQGLHSCQFWWASGRPMWSPNMILKGAELLLRAAFNARLAIIDNVSTNHGLSESEELFDQITQYYSLLLMEITNMEQKISGKKNSGDLFLETMFLEDDEENEKT